MSSNLPSIQLSANIPAEQADKFVSKALAIRSLDQLTTDVGVYSAKEITNVITGPIHTELTNKLDKARQRLTELRVANDAITEDIQKTAAKVITLAYARKVCSGIYSAVTTLAKRLPGDASYETEILVHDVEPNFEPTDREIAATAKLEFKIVEVYANGKSDSVSSTDVKLTIKTADLKLLNSAEKHKLPDVKDQIYDWLTEHQRFSVNLTDMDLLQREILTLEKDIRSLNVSAKQVLDKMALDALQQDTQACQHAAMLSQQIRSTMKSLS